MADWYDYLFPNKPSYGVLGPAEEADVRPGLPDKMAANAINSTVTLPQRVMDANQRFGTTGQYDPAPFLEAAMLPMGASAGVGVPMRAGETALGAGPIKAYHGSPYDFDKFDMSKIGTGEGAQAYGHGLYFAGNEGVAKSYREALAPGQAMTLNGVKYDQLTPSQRRVAQWIENTGAHPEEIAKISDHRAEKARRDASQFGLPGIDPDIFAKAHADTAQAARDLVAGGKWEVGRAPNGHMYEVNIKADPEHFLDWDKRLSEQHPTVQAAVNKAIPNDEFGRMFKSGGNDPLGSRIHEFMADAYGKGASTQTAADKIAGINALRDAGIPGIKYLDQGSRAEGKGTNNYVVFNDQLINILRKYGLAGAIPAGAAAAGMQGDKNSSKATSFADFL